MNGTVPPKGILFDLGDTIVGGEFDIQAAVGSLHRLIAPLGSCAFEEFYRLGQELAPEMESLRRNGSAEITFATFHRHVLARLGISSEPDWALAEREFLRGGHGGGPQCEPGLVRALEKCRLRGLKSAVLSNSLMRGETLTWLLEQAGVGGRFEFVMSSADYGMRKPHPELFRTALARLGLDASEVWFIGDSLENDVRGAEAVGMKGVWYNPGRTADAELMPERVLSHWNGLMELLAQEL